jgi:formate dehydrogenase subunit delta
MTAVTQIRLANDIAAQFHYLPENAAAEAVANHLRMFWDPRMRAELRALVERGQAVDDLDPIAAAAITLLPA